MANINVTIRMDEKLKAQADELFSDFGLSLSSAITMFVKQAVREQRIPFEVKRTGTETQMAADSSVEKLSKQLIEKNRTAYKELAK
ncbi:MAG: type II toxin-antitoxin system RelB/DinJ family antitoxin [Erysipelotrichaceae bacterium]|nr:type II toxin-antitoxin system RelB/DinJ family antitoxin [Erysipelotrichaceae bacterium]